MLNHLDLNGTWKIRGFDGQHGSVPVYLAETCDEARFLDAQVPGEIHLDLERAGLLPDCNLGTNAQSARWVEEQVWVYRTHFTAPEEALAQHAWLAFDGLDLCSVVYLNGVEVGKHENAHIPCRFDVTGKLRAGENVIAVQIESGLYSVAEKPGHGYNSAFDHPLHKRAWLRKPQYQFSWDWNPRLVNVGIFRDVRLEWTSTARIDATTLYPILAEDHSSATLKLDLTAENIMGAPLAAAIRLRVEETGAELVQEVELAPGLSDHSASVEIANPKLWWPLPHGEQPLYNVSCELVVDGKMVDGRKLRTGIRSVRIDRSKHPVEGDYFIVEVNGRPIFAKGGNWVPADMIYARPDESRFRELVRLAVDANMNTLRVWGGGLYADHRLLDACDEAGVLIWHDFGFACSKYPGDDVEFLLNIRREITHVVRDLSPHPSLLVWCGNNELEWAAWEWGYDREKPHPDYALYHLEIPKMVQKYDPSRPYWPSSPYSENNAHPQSKILGDQHPWHVSLGAGGPDFWEYRKDVSRFPNEGGVLGATSPATLRQFLPEGEYKLFSPSWEFHDNACNFWQARGVCYRGFEHWFDVKPEDMAFEDYLYYSALLQSEGLQEYIDNFRRRMFSSSSAIFWMYNDSWPASHGWTIVDYYLRRKLAYHPVRRAFAPVYVVPTVDGDQVIFVGVNDNPVAWSGEATFGIFALAGGTPVKMETSAELAPNSATLLGSLPLADWHALGADKTGAFALLSKDGEVVAQNKRFITPFKDLKWAESNIKVGRQGAFAVFSSDTFAWGVTLDLDGEAPISDDAFDLLPGIPYSIAWPAEKPLPVVQRVGSPLKLK